MMMLRRRSPNIPGGGLAYVMDAFVRVMSECVGSCSWFTRAGDLPPRERGHVSGTLGYEGQEILAQLGREDLDHEDELIHAPVPLLCDLGRHVLDGVKHARLLEPAHAELPPQLVIGHDVALREALLQRGLAERLQALRAEPVRGPGELLEGAVPDALLPNR